MKTESFIRQIESADIERLLGNRLIQKLENGNPKKDVFILIMVLQLRFHSAKKKKYEKMNVENNMLKIANQKVGMKLFTCMHKVWKRVLTVMRYFHRKMKMSG